MKWFIERCLTGIAHLLSSQPGTPELFNLVSLTFAVSYIVFEAVHWRTFDAQSFTSNAGTIVKWWGAARIAQGAARWIEGDAPCQRIPTSTPVLDPPTEP